MKGTFVIKFLEQVCKDTSFQLNVTEVAMELATELNIEQNGRSKNVKGGDQQTVRFPLIPLCVAGSE